MMRGGGGVTQAGLAPIGPVALCMQKKKNVRVRLSPPNT